MKNHNNILRLIASSVCLALAFVLPFLTGQIPEIGSMLLPMHIPVLLCGFICGWKWGLGVGFVAPLTRSFILGKPILFPGAVCMAFELGVYGLMAGLLHKLLPKKKSCIYISLLASMSIGRAVWGIAMAICMGIKGNAFTFGLFIAEAVTGAIPGIIIQIILIPILVMVLESRTKLKLND